MHSSFNYEKFKRNLDWLNTLYKTTPNNKEAINNATSTISSDYKPNILLELTKRPLSYFDSHQAFQKYLNQDKGNSIQQGASLSASSPKAIELAEKMRKYSSPFRLD